jgi:hypothetical protein
MASTDDSWRPTYDAMFGDAATTKSMCIQEKLAVTQIFDGPF